MNVYGGMECLLLICILMEIGSLLSVARDILKELKGKKP
jgi:hypothetical protein